MHLTYYITQLLYYFHIVWNIINTMLYESTLFAEFTFDVGKIKYKCCTYEYKNMKYSHRGEKRWDVTLLKRWCCIAVNTLSWGPSLTHFSVICKSHYHLHIPMSVEKITIRPGHAWNHPCHKVTDKTVCLCVYSPAIPGCLTPQHCSSTLKMDRGSHTKHNHPRRFIISLQIRGNDCLWGQWHTAGLKTNERADL